MILRRDESARSGRKAGAAIWIHQIARTRAGVIMTIVVIVPLNQLHHDTFANAVQCIAIIWQIETMI